MQLRFLRLYSIVVALLLASLGRAQQLTVAPDHTNGVYQVGDIVHWQVEWKSESNPPPAHYRLLQGGLTETGKGDVDFSNNVAELATTFDAPGTLLVEVKWKPDEGKDRRALAGAVAAPERIGLSAPCPPDFEAFWKTKLKELKKVPADPKLELVDIGKTNLVFGF